MRTSVWGLRGHAVAWGLVATSGVEGQVELIQLVLKSVCGQLCNECKAIWGQSCKDFKCHVDLIQLGFEDQVELI